MAVARTCRLAALSIVALLSSCGGMPVFDDAHRVDTAEQVGHVYVSAYPVVPWRDIGPKLEPKHALSTADARAMAAITTQSQVNQFMSSFSAGLGIGLPGKSWSGTSSTDAGGAVTTTATSKRDSGAVPGSSGAAATAIASDALSADLNKAAVASGVDASTQLMGGTAVFQLAAILDNQLSKAWLPLGYQANLVTFQINLQPARRDLPYDTYVDLTLLPGDWGDAVATSKWISRDAGTFPPVMVYPLVIADAMETSSVARSVEVMRQAALSLSGIVNNIGLNAGASRSSDHLQALVAGDRNSLTTVGRVSDHIVRIRIGAQQQGSSRLAIVPKTQNISMVVFTRAGDFKLGHLNSLAVVTRVTFADAKTGGTLPGRAAQQAELETEAAVRALLVRHEFRPVGVKECGGPAMLAPNLVRAAERSEYQYLTRCLAIADEDSRQVYRAQLDPAEAERARITMADYGLKPDALRYHRLCELIGNGECEVAGPDSKLALGPARMSAPASRPRCEGAGNLSQISSSAPSSNGQCKPDARAFVEHEFRRLVAALAQLRADAMWQRMLIPLPLKPPATNLPERAQLVLLQDDKKTAKVEIRGGTSLQLEKMEARLCIGQGAQQRLVMPTSLAVTDSGQTIAAAFPSLLKHGLAKAAAPGSSLPLSLVVAHGSDVELTKCQCHVKEEQKEAADKLLRLCATYALTEVPQEVKEDTNPLRVAAAALVMDAEGNARVAVATAKDAADIAVRVDGAELRSGEPALAFNPALNAYPLAAGAVTSLKLGNVTLGRNVYLYGLKGDKVVGDPVILPVQYASSGKN